MRAARIEHAICRHCLGAISKRQLGTWRLGDDDAPLNDAGHRRPGWCLARGGPFSTAPEWSNHEPLVLVREALEAWLAS